MIKFPCKLYDVPESVVAKMTQLMGIIPDVGINVCELYRMSMNQVVLADFIDALVCLFSIGAIDLFDNNVNKQC